MMLLAEHCTLIVDSGVSLSTLSKSVIVVNPETPEAKKLRSW